MDVQACLTREKCIKENITVPRTEILKQLDDKSLAYTILSHRSRNEVDYKGVTKLTEVENRDDIRVRNGCQKLIQCCKRPEKEGFQFLWADMLYRQVEQCRVIGGH
ncbi:hypothetical protein ID866_12956 [Astraeus odoratus]|nr:hypothetical protein ID866_12956 [Astraeus odoratus]